ncbi:MAG: hypothetical protein KatS3mg115_1236 [Candidatus Poribacteria bacterium]|nr:MAG: hypothetical protein KatS3mg115_1236 [Candidatus Poribacteria bacterium]
MEELEDGFPTEGRLAQLAYTESFHAVRTLVFDYSFTQLATLLGRLRAGESFPQAFEATYGLTVAMFAHDWKEKAGSGSRWLSVLAGLLALGLALTPVLLCGYWRRRREQASVLARWEEEERKPDSFYR